MKPSKLILTTLSLLCICNLAYARVYPPLVLLAKTYGTSSAFFTEMTVATRGLGSMQQFNFNNENYSTVLIEIPPAQQSVFQLWNNNNQGNAPYCTLTFDAKSNGTITVNTQSTPNSPYICTTSGTPGKSDFTFSIKES